MTTHEKQPKRGRGRPPEGGPPTEILAIRVTSDLVERIQAARADVKAAAGPFGAPLSKSAFAALLLERGLAAVKEELDAKRQRERAVARISRTKELTEADLERLQRRAK
jgi:hypothetical protein